MGKYVLTDETRVVCDITLRRIKATADFANIRSGDWGGWVESTKNLSQDDESWVSGNAQVFGDAQVFGEAKVYGKAQVSGDAQVSGEAQVFGDAQVSGRAKVYGKAQVFGDAPVFGDAQVSGEAQVSGCACVSGDSRVCGKAKVYGEAWVSGNARVSGNAYIAKMDDAFWVSNVGSHYDTATFFNCSDGIIRVKCGCFYGDMDEFAAAAQKTHGENKNSDVYRLLIQMAKIQISPHDESRP